MRYGSVIVLLRLLFIFAHERFNIKGFSFHSFICVFSFFITLVCFLFVCFAKKTMCVVSKAAKNIRRLKKRKFLLVRRGRHVGSYTWGDRQKC